MPEKTGPTNKGITSQLKDLIERSDQQELRNLLIGYLTLQEKNVRDFIRYCSKQTKIDNTLHSGWLILGDSVVQLEKKEKEDALHKQQVEFLKDLEQFRVECLTGDYSSEADFDEKRRAYADGDIYFEEYIYVFFDDHPGIQAYIAYMKDALRYYNKEDFQTAYKALRILVDIYDFDTKESPLFIDDDDFPDADLSYVHDINIKKMRECLKISEEKDRAPLLKKKI